MDWKKERETYGSSMKQKAASYKLQVACYIFHVSIFPCFHFSIFIPNLIIMHINMIAAMSSNRVIGQDNQLPRHYSEDMKHFKEITTGKVIVMWYNTYASIGRPLPNRRNIILTSKVIEGLESFDSISSMLEKLNDEGVTEVYIIWWASVYQQFLPIADRIYLTEIKKAYIGDTYFPIFEDEFTQAGREEYEDLDFVVYEKKSA